MRILQYYIMLSASICYYIFKVKNLLNDTSVNRDSFNQLYSQTRSYIIQPRYTVFKLKYDLTSIAGS